MQYCILNKIYLKKYHANSYYEFVGFKKKENEKNGRGDV